MSAYYSLLISQQFSLHTFANPFERNLKYFSVFLNFIAHVYYSIYMSQFVFRCNTEFFVLLSSVGKDDLRATRNKHVNHLSDDQPDDNMYISNRRVFRNSIIKLFASTHEIYFLTRCRFCYKRNIFHGFFFVAIIRDTSFISFWTKITFYDYHTDLATRAK